MLNLSLLRRVLVGNTEAASGVKLMNAQVRRRTGKSPARLIPRQVAGGVAGEFLGSLFRVSRGGSGLRQAIRYLGRHQRRP